MEEVKKIRTACRSCHGDCGVIAHVKTGKVIKVEGDPNSPVRWTKMTKMGTLVQREITVDRRYGKV